MINKEKIIAMAEEIGVLKNINLVRVFGISRQYAARFLAELVAEGKMLKIGATRNAAYILPAYADRHPEIISNRYVKIFTNQSLEEHKVLDDIERSFAPLKKIAENVKSIFTYAFSEMMNNAIEHSGSDKIKVTVALNGPVLSFVVDDFGIGVFRNIMRQRQLNSELEAIQDLLKGKMTTAPKLHSGEGIFFTSKVGDIFVLDSFGNKLIVDNKLPDIFVKKTRGIKQGTKVSFSLDVNTKHRLNDVFKKYTNLTEDSDYGFDKTEIRVRLYLLGGVHISRSQARRVLTGLEKFKLVVMDYDQVPMIGQAFADEIYRVFHTKRPDIEIQNENMNEAVRFMINRAKTEAEK